MASLRSPGRAARRRRCRRSSAPSTVDTEWWQIFLNKQVELKHVVPSDEGEAFRHFFRTSRKTFDYICSIVKEDLISRPPSGLINIEGRLLSVEKQVAIAMRRLVSGDSQVSVGIAFGVGRSIVSQVTWRFIESMEDRAIGIICHGQTKRDWRRSKL